MIPQPPHQDLYCSEGWNPLVLKNTSNVKHIKSANGKLLVRGTLVTPSSLLQTLKTEDLVKFGGYQLLMTFSVPPNKSKCQDIGFGNFGLYKVFSLQILKPFHFTSYINYKTLWGSSRLHHGWNIDSTIIKVSSYMFRYVSIYFGNFSKVTRIRSKTEVYSIQAQNNGLLNTFLQM